MKPIDAFVTNGWVFEIQGLVSPHFESLDGISRETGEVSVIDGYTNTTHKFSNQLKSCSDITLKRARDGSIDDTTMKELYRKCEEEGFRFDGNLVKFHNGKEMFRIMFLGMRIKKYDHPSLSTGGTEKYTQTFSCSVTDWVEI